MKALILAGGSGKEALPLSKYCPKTMFHLHGKPLLDYVISALKNIGIEEFVVVVGYRKEISIPLLHTYRQQGLSIEILDQGELLGIEGAILAAKNQFIGQETFLMAYSDIIAPSQFYNHLINTYINTAADGAIAVTLVGKSKEFGIVGINARGFITEILPEPLTDQDTGQYIFAGASILPVDIFELLHEHKQLPLALAQLINERRRISASIWQDDWVDVGYAWDLLAANHDLFNKLEYARIHKSAKISSSAHISGLVLIEEGVIVGHNAQIVGPCFIGKNSYIGTNSLIREYASIGRNCKIGYSVEIKNSVIQHGTKIGRLSFVGDSVVGEDVILGSGATTMNFPGELEPQYEPKIIKGRIYPKLGAVIGPRTTVGSNTVILPGILIDADQTIPPGTVIRSNYPNEI